MKYYFVLPLSALVVLCVLAGAVAYGFLPPGIEVLKSLQVFFAGYFYLLILCIILLEAIIFVGFYFPGQFFAVILVVLSEPQPADIFWLTIVMVVAATLGSLINYLLGWRTAGGEENEPDISIKKLLIAMLHINSLAFFMFSQGASRQSVKVVFWAGLLNLPYYLLLIVGTSMLSEQVMQMAENTWLLITAVSIWLVIALCIDVKKAKAAKCCS